MCVFGLRPLLFHYRGRTQTLSSPCKSDRDDFTYWTSFLPSNHMKEISPKTETLSTNSESLSSAWKCWENHNQKCFMQD